MSSQNTATDSSATGRGTGASPGEATLTYEEVDITTTAGFRPMIGAAATILVSFFVLGGLPFYWTGGTGQVTLMAYTMVLWGIVCITTGFVFEYYVERNESAEAASEGT
jgi:fatty acid desaturase